MRRTVRAFPVPLVLGTCILALLGGFSPAGAQVITFPTVMLDGSQEVPPVPTMATGTGTITLNTMTNQMSWTLSFSGLSSPQTAAHFHTGAVGVNGGVTINIGVGNPISGMATLTATQLSNLLAGNLYMNVHTMMFTGGEIRGQVIPPQAAATVVGTGCQGTSLTANGLPAIGNAAFSITVGGAPGSSAFLFPALGIAPVPLAIGGGCFVYLDLPSAISFINAGIAPIGPLPIGAGGTVTLPLPIAPINGAAGLSIDVQGVVAGPGGTATTNALSLTLGF